jgi:hypothetical protein
LKRSASWMAALALAAAAGCGETQETKTPVAMGDIPAAVVKAAQKELPDVAFDAAFKEKVGKVDAFELRGKDKTGKVREVEVSREGKVLGVE